MGINGKRDLEKAVGMLGCQKIRKQLNRSGSATKVLARIKHYMDQGLSVLQANVEYENEKLEAERMAEAKRQQRE